MAEMGDSLYRCVKNRVIHTKNVLFNEMRQQSDTTLNVECVVMPFVRCVRRIEEKKLFFFLFRLVGSHHARSTQDEKGCKKRE